MSKINMVNKNIINIDDLHDIHKKDKFYNDIVYLIYGVNNDKIYFKDHNKNNLSRDNCIIKNNFIDMGQIKRIY